MNVKPIREQIEVELKEQLRKVMAGDEVVRYEVAVEVAVRAARMACHLEANRLRQHVLDPTLLVAGLLLSRMEDNDEDSQEQACAIALELGDRLAIMLTEEHTEETDAEETDTPSKKQP